MKDKYPKNVVLIDDQISIFINHAKYSGTLVLTEDKLTFYLHIEKGKKIVIGTKGIIDIKAPRLNWLLIKTSVNEVTLIFSSEEKAKKWREALEKQIYEIKKVSTSKNTIIDSIESVVKMLDNLKKSEIDTSKIQNKVNSLKSELLKFIETTQKFEKLKSIASNEGFKSEVNRIKSKIENMENLDETEKTIEEIITQIEKRKSIKKKIDLIECPFCGRKIFSDSILCSYCGKKLKYSTEMERLLERRKFYNEKLEIVKECKNIIPENEYEEKYNKIMDHLVDIEDKIIQEKMKGGKKK